MNVDNFSLAGVMGKAYEGFPLTREEILFLLNLEDQREVMQLHRVARKIRASHFGNKVFLYGFLYFSTHCKNNCSFCSYRKSNSRQERYRKNEKDIVEAAVRMRDSGVHLIDLTMGEDPYISDSDLGLTRLIRMIRQVRGEVILPLMISPGVLDDSMIEQVAQAGTDWFACYQETYSVELFSKLRVGQSFDARVHAKKAARKKGMLIEEGILAGAGESLEDIADSLLWMREMGFDQVRVMTFVPQADTPMADVEQSDGSRERIIISVMRLLMPDILIPASLDIDGLAGLAGRLDAGANVITSIVPPGKGLAGVANNSLDIEESRRSVDSLSGELQRLGMEIATQDEYRDWMITRKEKHQNVSVHIDKVV